MTHDEALQILGVAQGSSPEEIRRAYSRRTRTWNPAADPDGLRRLRAAHDLLLGNPSQQPPPLPPPESQEPPPLPAFSGARAATAELPPPLPGSYLQARPVPLLKVEPDRPQESAFLRILIICGGGLVLFLALWMWVSSLKEKNQPQMPPPRPYSPPVFAGYVTVQEGMSEVCPTLRTDFCRHAAVILQATAQRKCSDAKAARERIAETPIPGLDPGLDKGRNPRTRALRQKLDEEIARCWKFWNP